MDDPVSRRNIFLVSKEIYPKAELLSHFTSKDLPDSVGKSQHKSQLCSHTKKTPPTRKSISSNSYQEAHMANPNSKIQPQEKIYRLDGQVCITVRVVGPLFNSIKQSTT